MSIEFQKINMHSTRICHKIADVGKFYVCYNKQFRQFIFVRTCKEFLLWAANP